MARERNPRVLAVESVKGMKRRLDWLLGRWVVPQLGIVYETDGYRKRRPDEYPENRADYWREMCEQAFEVAEQASALRKFAAQQYHACLARNQAAPE